MATREEIYGALFALVTPLIDLDAEAIAASPNHLLLDEGASTTPEKPFRTISRDVVEVQRVDPGNQPVLMLYEMDETFEPRGDGLLRESWTAVFIFGVTSEKGTPGQTLLNPLIDRVVAALAPDIARTRQTLGGLVYDARVTGTAGKDHGNNSTRSDARQASYYLPVKIVLAS